MAHISVDFFFFFTFGIRVVHSATLNKLLPLCVRRSARRWHPVTDEVNPALSRGLLGQKRGWQSPIGPPHTGIAHSGGGQSARGPEVGGQGLGWRGLTTRALCPDGMTQSLQAPETGGSQEERGEETLQRRGSKRNVLFSAHVHSGSFLFCCSPVILLPFPGEFNPVSSFCACTHRHTHRHTETHTHRPSDTDTNRLHTNADPPAHIHIHRPPPNTHTHTHTDMQPPRWSLLQLSGRLLLSQLLLLGQLPCTPASEGLFLLEQQKINEQRRHNMDFKQQKKGES